MGASPTEGLDELSELRGLLESTRREASQWRAAALDSWADGMTVRAAQDERDRLAAELTKSKAELERCKSRVEKCNAAIAKHQAELAALREEATANRQVARTRASELKRLRTSTSWRITKPLRAAARGVRKLFSGGSARTGS